MMKLICEREKYSLLHAEREKKKGENFAALFTNGFTDRMYPSVITEGFTDE